MSLETYTNAAGEVFKIQHPPGLSIIDADVITETVTKANSATAFAANDVVEVIGNTSSGETWRAYASANLRPARRYGHVVTASPGGTPTMDIKRHPRTVMPCSATTQVFSTAQWGGSILPYFIKKGDAQQANGVYPSIMQRQPPFGSITVTKTSAEIWANAAPIYGYINAGVTLYTNSFALSAGFQKRWRLGVATGAHAAGTTVGNVWQSLMVDALMNPSNTSFYAHINCPYITISPTTVTGTIGLSNSVWMSVDRLSISNAPSATCQIGIALVVYIDETVTPTVYGIIEQAHSSPVAGFDDIWGSICMDGATFVQCHPDTVRKTGLNTFGTPTSGWYTLLHQTDAGNTAPTYLVAPALICRGMCKDLALDVTVPSPWSNLRIIWAMASATAEQNRFIWLMPSCSIRTPTSAPSAGMTATGRLRSRGGLARLQSYPVQSDYPSTLPIRGMVTMHHLPLRESRELPYVWTGYRLVNDTGDTVTSFLASCGSRGFDFPSSFSVTWYRPAAASVEYRWATYDYSTGTFTALTAFVAAAGAAPTWTATVVPPAMTSGDVYALCLQSRINGVTIKNGINEDAAQAGWASPVYDGVGYGVYPFDVIKTQRLVDDAHQGWIWPTQPTLPVANWGSAPAIAYTAGQITVGTRLAPTWAVDPGFAIVGNGNPSPNAGGPGGPTIRMQADNYSISNNGSYTNIWALTNDRVTTPLTIAKLSSYSGAMDVKVSLFQAVGLNSKYGPAAMVKQWDYTITMP